MNSDLKKIKALYRVWKSSTEESISSQIQKNSKTEEINSIIVITLKIPNQPFTVGVAEKIGLLRGVESGKEKFITSPSFYQVLENLNLNLPEENNRVEILIDERESNIEKGAAFVSLIESLNDECKFLIRSWISKKCS